MSKLDRDLEPFRPSMQRRSFLRAAMVGTVIVGLGGAAYVFADDEEERRARETRRPDGKPRLPPSQYLLKRLRPMGGEEGDPTRDPSPLPRLPAIGKHWLHAGRRAVDLSCPVATAVFRRNRRYTLRRSAAARCRRHARARGPPRAPEPSTTKWITIPPPGWRVRGAPWITIPPRSGSQQGRR